MYEKYGFLPELQKWIVGKRLVKDKETLEECGINFPGAVVFLYLLSKDSNEEACSRKLFELLKLRFELKNEKKFIKFIYIFL